MTNKYSDPKEWGPHFWYVMKCIAFNYSENPNPSEILNTKSFYINLKNLLPCDECKNNYKNSLKKYNIDNYLHCRHKLMEWVKLIQEDNH